MAVKLFNTITRRKETFEPLHEGRVGIYSCGPTVYDYFHIGNARVFIVFDVIRRYLEYRGYKVTYVQNFTDIEDKMIKRAAERGITLKELAEEMIAAYFADAQVLGVRPADHHPRATDFIPGMIELIQKLMEKGLAYQHQGDVYFSVENFPPYGRLSGQPLEELVSGARVEVEEGKRHPGDFALWKGQKAGEPAWESPWGPGRPGWHIECSVMAMEYLGDTIDIHAGGPDLIFPHHENEAAQSEGATGKPFSRYWLHAGYLKINKEKMSKSLGNVLTVRQILETVDPQVIRFFMLSSHYRSPINFSPELLEHAEAGLRRMQTMVANAEDLLAKLPEGEASAGKPLREKVLKAREGFIRAMNDDFNTAEGIADLFHLAREVNIYVNQAGPLDGGALREALDFYREVDDMLGFIFPASDGDSLEKEVEALIERRERARREKNWQEADAIRDKLKKMGISLEDTPHGVRWRREE